MISYTAANTILHVMYWLCAYFLIIGPMGYFKAWIAYKMGDPTMVHEDLLTLNPIAHLNAYNLLILLLLMNAPSYIYLPLLLLYFMGAVGRTPLVNPWVINNTSKYLIAIFSPLLFNILLGGLALAIGGFFEGMEIAGFFTSFAPVFVALCGRIILLVVNLTFLSFFNNIIGIIFYFWLHRYVVSQQAQIYIYVLTIFLFLLLATFFGGYVNYAISMLMQLIAYGVSQLIGVR